MEIFFDLNSRAKRQPRRLTALITTFYQMLTWGSYPIHYSSAEQLPDGMITLEGTKS